MYDASLAAWRRWACVCVYKSRSGFGNWHISVLTDKSKSEVLRAALEEESQLEEEGVR